MNFSSGARYDLGYRDTTPRRHLPGDTPQADPLNMLQAWRPRVVGARLSRHLHHQARSNHYRYQNSLLSIALSSAARLCPSLSLQRHHRTYP
jgi:hypothetical protein